MARQLRLRAVPDAVTVETHKIREFVRNARILVANVAECRADLGKKRVDTLTKASALGEIDLDLDRLRKEIDGLEAMVAEKGGRS